MSMNCPVLFVIALYLVPSVVNVYELSSLACDRSVSCAQCCLCLWIVQSCLWPLCILCPVLPVSMNCPVLFVIVLCLVSSVANVYELSSLVCDRSVSCAQCCHCLWIVQSRLPYWCSLTYKYKLLLRTDNTMTKRKRTTRQTPINKTLHKKLKIEQPEPH
jgi:hypothetical protein